MIVDIAYIVSHGFAARMVMQTNLLGKLVEAGMKVALIAPDKSDTNLVSYCRNKNIELYEFNPTQGSLSSNYIKSRTYFLENINNNPALYEKYIYATKYTKHNSVISWLKPRVYKFIHDSKEVVPSIRSWYLRREDKILNSTEAVCLLQKIDAKKVISTYPVNFAEGMLLKAAKQLKIETVIHLLSWDNISCKGHFPQLADEYIAWGPIMKEELMEYYQIPENSIYVSGVPHFDMHLESKRNPQPEKYLNKLGLQPNQPYLFIGMSSPRFAPKEIDIVEWLAKEITNGTFGKEMQLVIRPHPQNVQGGMADQSWLPRLQSLHNGKVAVDFPDLVKSNMQWSMQQQDMERLSHLLAGCTVSLNSGSTLSIDALMCGVPVIFTSFDGVAQLAYWRSAKRLLDYSHLKKLVKLGGISVCHSFSELESMIKRYVANKNENIEKREWTISQEVGSIEVNATERVCNFLSDAIDEKVCSVNIISH